MANSQGVNPQLGDSGSSGSRSNQKKVTTLTHSNIPKLWEEDDDEPPGCLVKAITKVQTKVTIWYQEHREILINVVYIIFILLYGVYFGYALFYDWRRAIALIVFTIFVVLLLLYRMLMRYFSQECVENIWKNIHKILHRSWRYGKWVLLVSLLIGVLLFIIFDACYQPVRLVSGIGIPIYLLLAWIVSNNRLHVSFQVVVSGVALQLAIGLFMLRWDRGLQALQFLGDQIIVFMSYTDAGSRFVFGDKFTDHPYVFKAMPSVLFFGAVVNVLYHWGVLQWLIHKYGAIMEVVMSIGPTEAFLAAANCFLGFANAILTVRRFVKKMTLSELHCALVAGFATASGIAFAIYFIFGVPPTHLITASILSAPAALVIAKIMYPEVKQSSLQSVKTITYEESKARNTIHAFTEGATDAIPLVVHLVVNMIGALAILHFLNTTLGWFGARVGLDLSFQLICSYLFVPLPLFMGVELNDCFDVARLIGTKLFFTHVVGYAELGKLIQNRENGMLPAISPRSEVIATYALCGFCNLTEIGIGIATLGAIIPERRGDLSKLIVRSIVSANLACFLTAAVAGFLYSG